MANDDRPLYERDPQAFDAYLAEGNAKQARKRISVDALIRDEGGRILLVDPNYKPGWDLPGGMVEADESPRAALRRELREELGVEIALGGMLVVDWVPKHGPWDDMVTFIYDAGQLPPSMPLRLDDGELDSIGFVTLSEAVRMIDNRLARRLERAVAALDRKRAEDLEDGHLPANDDAD